MNCPKCESSLLNKVNVKEVEVDKCSRCQGIWFDEKELSDLLGLNPQHLRPLKSSKENESLNLKRGVCPRDGSTLARVYSNEKKAVVVDTCVKCHGIWLDGGELAELLKD